MITYYPLNSNLFLVDKRLRSFATDWRKERQEKDDMVRKRLATEREILIQNGAPSQALMKVLEEIFRSYCSYEDAVNSGDVNISLPYTMAARLWYRCGLKLAKLDSLLEEAKSPSLCFKDFVNVIETVIAEDEEAIHKRQSIADPSKIEFEVRATGPELSFPMDCPLKKNHFFFIGWR